MIDFSHQSTYHSLNNEILPIEKSENHYLQSPWYDRNPLFDMFRCFPSETITEDANTSNGLPSQSELFFEDELKGWDELSDEAWLDNNA